MGARVLQTLWSPPETFSSMFNTFWVWYCEHSLKISSTKPSWVCEWVKIHLLIQVCVCVSEREFTSLPPFRLIKRRTNLANRMSDERTNKRTDEQTHIETLNPRPGHTQEDTHYTEWYRYPEWFFLSLRVLTTHPRVYPWHQGTLVSSQTNRTLSDTHYTEGYPWHWVIPTNRILTAAHWTIHSFSPFFLKMCKVNEMKNKRRKRKVKDGHTHAHHVVIILLILWLFC